MKRKLVVFTLCLFTNAIVLPRIGQEGYDNVEANYQEIAVSFNENDKDIFSGIDSDLYKLPALESEIEKEKQDAKKKKEKSAQEKKEGLKKEEATPITKYTTTRVNFRLDGSMEAEIIDVLNPNQKVEVTGIEGDWYSVSLDGQIGYINSTYLSDEQTPIEECNRWKMDLSKEERALLANIVWLEARGETLVGQEAVVEVVLNRISSIEYPDSLYDVLSQKTQFTSWLQQESADPTKKEYLAISNVLEGKTNHTTMNTLYFSTKPRNSNISAHIGNHYFCEI
ncbi:cell wall hydrolase [Lachnospiraceae bacterium ZAX-1]